MCNLNDIRYQLQNQINENSILYKPTKNKCATNHVYSGKRTYSYNLFDIFYVYRKCYLKPTLLFIIVDKRFCQTLFHELEKIQFTVIQ